MAISDFKMAEAQKKRRTKDIIIESFFISRNGGVLLLSVIFFDRDEKFQAMREKIAHMHRVFSRGFFSVFLLFFRLS